MAWILMLSSTAKLIYFPGLNCICLPEQRNAAGLLQACIPSVQLFNRPLRSGKPMPPSETERQHPTDETDDGNNADADRRVVEGFLLSALATNSLLLKSQTRHRVPL
jgi:hypothetical protein